MSITTNPSGQPDNNTAGGQDISIEQDLTITDDDQVTGAGPIPMSLLPDSASVDERGRLSIGGCDLIDLADEWGTPLFVYDEDHLRARCREAVEGFGADNAVYATKAFLCVAMARLAHEEGMLLDVASGGEMHVCRAAGVPADRMVLHGNNKSLDELRLACREGVERIVVDSLDEIDRLESLVGEVGHRIPKVLLRVTPGIEAHTHEYIMTGQEDSKFGFGIGSGVAEAAVKRASASPGVELVGLHMHIGSQIFVAESFARALEILAPFFNPLGLTELSVGGGLGVAYVDGEESEPIPTWAGRVARACTEAGIDARITAEPGRSIAGQAAVTLYRAGTIKEIPGIRTFVAVDGGMIDNPRPALYGSDYETFLPRAVRADRPSVVRLVGKHCESGDVLVRNGRVPSDLVVGDIVSTPVTGAYGHSMGSNYNKLPRPAIVFCSGGDARLVVRRESYDDLLRSDVL